MLIQATSEHDRLQNERRVNVKVNRPDHHINWEEVDRDAIDNIEDAVVAYLRSKRGYPATHTVVSLGIIANGFKYPSFLNGRDLGSTIRLLADRQHFELVRRVEVNGRMTDYLWAGCQCHHEVWIEAMAKISQGKRVRLK